ncbi:CvpA family protein [Vibrio chagasii]|nr:CvpA family protein [Vibrio chagasii]
MFVATLVVGALVNYVIRLVQKTGRNKGTDRILGVVFGGLRGVFDCFCDVVFSWMRLLHSQVLSGGRIRSWFEFSRIIAFFEHLQATSSFLSGAMAPVNVEKSD